MNLCSHVAGSPEENSRKKARRVGRKILQRRTFRGGSWKDRLVKIEKVDGGGGRVGRKSQAGFTLEGKYRGSNQLMGMKGGGEGERKESRERVSLRCGPVCKCGRTSCPKASSHKHPQRGN